MTTDRIVGLLQNPWWKPDTPDRYKEMYRTDYRFRHIVLARSRTGQNLRKALGDELFDTIYWTDCTFESGDHSGFKGKADIAFLEQEIAGAAIVVAFGAVAQTAMRRLTLGGDSTQPANFLYLECCHPTARDYSRWIRESNEVREKITCR